MINKNFFDRCMEAGFSYIEMLIAITILLVGILGAVGALSANLLRSYESENQIIAKQIALSTLESIISAKDIAKTGAVEGWHSIGSIGTNPVDGVNKGIFMTGWRPIREDIGWDGVAGTIDDACDAPNPCAVSGRSTNSSQIMQGFQRKIAIFDVADPERPSPPHAITSRRVEVTVKYFMNTVEREHTVSTIIANY